MSKQTAKWVSMKDAAKALGKSKPTITRLVSKGAIQTIPDPTDKRIRLVDLNEIRRLYSVRQKEN